MGGSAGSYLWPTIAELNFGLGDWLVGR